MVKSEFNILKTDTFCSVKERKIKNGNILMANNCLMFYESHFKK